MKKIIVIDVEKCLGCRSCELACAVAHSKSKNLKEAVKEKELPEKRLFVEQSPDVHNTSYNLKLTAPLQCRHCEDAPCVEICPTKAISHLEGGAEEGVVLVNNELCIGCKWCVSVCPFGIIKLDRKGKTIIKCDRCIERLKKNELPACVSACPTKAIKFVSADEVGKDKRRKFLTEIKKTV